MRVYKVTVDVLRTGHGAGWEEETYNVIAGTAVIAWGKVSGKPKTVRWKDEGDKKHVNTVKKVLIREVEIICELGKVGD